MTTPSGFAINGRFLAQPVTGVQRYARQITARIDSRLAAAGAKALLLAPPSTPNPALDALKMRHVGMLRGHAWEQVELPMAWRGRLLNLGNTAPLAHGDQVVCLHDANVFTMPESYSAAFRRAYRLLQPRIAQRAARVATVSSASARSLARHLGLDPRSIAVLPNGHEHALAWSPGSAAIAPVALEPRGERPFVLAVGSRARHKNLQLLASIAPALTQQGIDIVVAGGGGSVFADCREAAGGGVIEIGRVEDDDLAWLMDRALCLAFPSYTEGFGLPIVEAMARGCPVLSSDRASMPEVCGGAAMMASPDDPEAWIRGISKLSGSATLRQDLAGRGRENAARFRWSDSAEGYLELLRDPAGARRAISPAPAMVAAPKVAVIIATIGRPGVVAETVNHLLAHQTLQPSAFIVSCASDADAGTLMSDQRVQVITGPAGLPRQRNRALAAVPADTDIVAFFDDDFVADAGWIASVALAFRDEPWLGSLTGDVLADGIKGPGIGFDEALGLIAAAAPPQRTTWTEPYSPYGCNMAFRASAIRSMRFDERLVLYGWLEDRDFGAVLRRHGGRLARTNEARGVHLGVKGGRVRGERLGYSQVVNPLYMLRKGTMTFAQVADHVFRNIAANLARSLRPEPHVDRRGRLRGNVLAMRDIIRGQVEPERAALILPPQRSADDHKPTP
jgi:glycosyltransferase involved in cell wall biosynthesis